jgi:hypothetical protein
MQYFFERDELAKNTTNNDKKFEAFGSVYCFLIINIFYPD